MKSITYSILLLTSVMLLFSGCATSSDTWTGKWYPKRGKVSFETVIQEIGPPDRVQNLPNGQKIASWLVSGDLETGVVFTSAGTSREGVGVETMGAGLGYKVNLLWFGPDGVLTGQSSDQFVAEKDMPKPVRKIPAPK